VSSQSYSQASVAWIGKRGNVSRNAQGTQIDILKEELAHIATIRSREDGFEADRG